jgi:putative transcriptional regulator
MGRFSIKLRRCVAAALIALSMTLIAIASSTQTAQSTDLTTPSILVATRELQDPLFQHSVILMVPSTEPPLLAGLIINNPAKERVQDKFPSARQLKGADEPMYLGGPVEPDDTSIIFRAWSAIGSAKLVFDDVYVATGHDAIAAILKDPRVADLRVIAGRAQWLRDQLYVEVMARAWFVVPAKSELVFSDPKDLWSTLVKGGDLEEAKALENLPYSGASGTNWQRQISPN